MVETIAALTGVWFLIAVAAEFAAVAVEQAGAPRAPSEEPARPGFPGMVLALASLLTPGVLLIHAFVVTASAGDGVRMAAMALPVAAMILGAIVGAVAGLAARPARVMLRMAAIVFALGALILALAASWPSLRIVVDAAQNGWVIEAPAG